MFSELESTIKKEFPRPKKGDSEGASASEALTGSSDTIFVVLFPKQCAEDATRMQKKMGSE